MRLKLLLPDQVVADTTVKKVSAEGLEGAFTMLPKHIDYATVLVPGLLSYVDDGGDEIFFAVDDGVLVKKGDMVRVSVRNAVRGEDLGDLRETVREKFEILEEQERHARAVLASLESDLVYRFIDLGKK